MASLKDEIIADLAEIEDEFDNLTFTYNGNEYDCIASVSTYNKTLDIGGFRLVRQLNMTVRLLDTYGSNIFTNTIPQPQEKITFQDTNYRIQHVHTHPTGAYIRILAEELYKGV